MKLYELPRDQDTKVYVEYDSDNGGGEFIYFHHIDGMYSYCTTQQGDVCHLFAGTELEPYKDGWKIINTKDVTE